MNSAVYDACVLFSGSLRDFLLRLASNKLVVPFWSEEIQSEWVRSLLEKRPGLKRENLERTCREMNLHFPNALVHGYESLIPSLELPDPDDRHVLAVAIHANVDCIVTNNLKDFPAAALKSCKIEILLPDEFALRLWKKDQPLFLKAVRNHRANLSRPPKTADEYIATLEEQGLSKTVAFLRQHKADI